MELSNIEIKNFKSIEKCNIDLKKECRVLVGQSESGKSNILLALSSLDNSFELSRKYVKEGTRKDEDAHIKYVLTMTLDEEEVFFNNVKEKIYSSRINKFIQCNNHSQKLYDFLKKSYVYKIDVRTNNRNLLYYLLSDEKKYTIDENHKILNATQENPVVIQCKKTQETFTVTEKTIINIDEYSNESGELSVITPKILNDFCCNFGLEVAKNGIPSLLFWEYKDEYLLPSSVIIKDFVSDPSTNIPLKYIFELNGIYDIESEYNECIEMGESSFQNLLDSINKKTNEYLKKVWNSMPKDCRLELRESGDSIIVRIKDASNSYSLDKRSDGFKRIITFMIMLSVKNTNKSLNNTLILIDEPETKIDIPGQEYLKLELIKISLNNYVFYSTHSTSMVDNSCVSRHLIVKKEKEATEIEEATDGNYDSAMTLYKSLGMQVYAVINNINLVFEGWTDLNLFRVALKANKTLQNKYKNIGSSHVPGATHFRNFATLWGLLAKDYYIISDADLTSTELKNSFVESNLPGTWYKYDEFGIDNAIETCEDFYKNTYIKSMADKYGKIHNYESQLLQVKLEDSSKSKLTHINDWINYNVIDTENRKNHKKQFKIELSNNLKATNIDSAYFVFLEELYKKLNIK